ncbi:YciI family protein [Pinibacter soli]|uniref:YciI family protein n=1 Tax=Pinibacter soli TaxID=3044211 RepID=A0ABT6RH85_9BACT|nr:YciI family protein [Pinibacter soli]MDI3321224.1 YciI family protein [Pinibacter soli]
MKTIVIGEGSGATMATILSVYPRHKAIVDKYVERGEVLGIGPFADRGGNLAIFTTHEAAEAFVAEDPFVLEGIIKSFVIKDWDDSM